MDFDINFVEPLFQSAANKINFPVDQVRYIVLMFLSYPIALVFKYALHPDHTPITLRYAYSMTWGVIMGLLCFGPQQMAILLFINLVSYGLLIFLPPTVTQRYSMVWAMGSISTAHIYRLVTDYGGFHLDFTGPLMVIVQKITLVAYALHDGQGRPESQLNKDQLKQRIFEPPSLLVYLCYMFNFHSFLAGPSCTIKDYLSFMDGSNLRPSPHTGNKEPSILYPVLSKLFFALAAMVLFVGLTQYIDNSVILDPQYSQPLRIGINYVNSFRIRNRYYFIWLLADSISNCAGLGFSGYRDGVAMWDLTSNLYFKDIELGTNIRAIANGWNACTSMWLRRCVYERTKFAPTLVAYTVSAWWHGFYPGYYFCFVYFGFVTEASRKMRRLLRHHFQRNRALSIFYDIITWTLAHIYLDFGTLPLDLMFASRVVTYWSYYYYTPLVTSVVVTLFFPSGKSKRQAKDQAVENNDGVIDVAEIKDKKD